MEAFGVIKGGDVIADHGAGGGDGLGFERAPKRFASQPWRRCPNSAFAAHAGDGVAQAQIGSVILAGLLAAAKAHGERSSSRNFMTGGKRDGAALHSAHLLALWLRLLCSKRRAVVWWHGLMPCV